MLDPGSKYGRLVVVEDRGHKQVICKCVCGSTKVVGRYRLTSGRTKSCGCLKSEMLRDRWRKHSAENAIPKGAKFGRLEVLRSARQYVVCRCACGIEKRVYKYDLLKGKTKSCGCLMREVSAETMRQKSTRHGGWNSKEWRSWSSMISRCTATYEKGYKYWGGRGIGVCAQWSGSGGFVSFLSDVGRAPSQGHYLDRIDNDGDYEPGNVRWATAKMQARNRRNTRYVTAFGKMQTAVEWSEETGIAISTIKYRVDHGWSPEDAVSIVPDVRNRQGGHRD